MGRARPVLENTALLSASALASGQRKAPGACGEASGARGGVRRRPGKLSGGLGDYLEDCAASRQSLRSSSYVKTICSPRSPCSKCPRPDIREKRRISVVGRPSSTAARCSPTSSWILMFNVTLNLPLASNACSHPIPTPAKCFVIYDKASGDPRRLHSCAFPYSNSARIWTPPEDSTDL